MLERTSPVPTELSATPRAARAWWPFAFVAIAGLMGASGVLVAAAGAHVAGGENARTAADFLMLHAATVLGAAGVALSMQRASRLLLIAMALICLGAVLFGGEIAISSLAAWRPVPLAAPTGGLCLIGGWLLLAIVGVIEAVGMARQSG